MNVETSQKLKPKHSLTQFALIIAVIAVIIAGFAVFQNIQTHQRYALEFQQIQIKLNQTQSALALQQQAVNSTQQSLLQQIQQTGYQNEDWVLAESLYLLKLAHYNLVFLDNIKLATKLLRAANNNLAELDDPTSLNARQKLTQTIIKLKAAEQLDVSSILLQLNAIQKEINQLPLVRYRVSPQTQEQTINKQRWTQRLWNDLKQVVVIRHLKNPPPLFLSPEQQIYLLDNIQYQLTQAQWAALHHKQQLYQASLGQAINWIQQYFLQNDNATQSVIAALQQLTEINVAPKIPSITDAIHAVQALLNNRQSHTLTTPTQKKQTKSSKELEQNSESTEPKA